MIEDLNIKYLCSTCDEDLNIKYLCSTCDRGFEYKVFVFYL